MHRQTVEPLGMIVTITIKLTPETRGEMIDTFGRSSREYMDKIREFIGRGVFGPVEKIKEPRFLLDSGRWA